MGIRRGSVLAIAAACSLAVAAAAARCSGSTSPSTSSQTPAATITITAAGASPRDVVVAPGSQVLFINNDTRQHQMYSDPHPEHTDCPEFDQVGSLLPGQQRQTGNLNTPRVCRFHDHIFFEDRGLQGTVTIR